jgi:hypothetical protein
VDRAAASEETSLPSRKQSWFRISGPLKKRRFKRNLLAIIHIADDFDGPVPPELQKYFE